MNIEKPYASQVFVIGVYGIAGVLGMIGDTPIALAFACLGFVFSCTDVAMNRTFNKYR